jgi:predicted NUDIX family NTP pyrophosphohydrolase
MPKKSAGLLMYRFVNGVPEVLLVHPGGPFWKKKDAGAWSIPKGEYDDQEEPLAVALREFQEETGFQAQGPFLELAPVKQKGGKTIAAWACEGDLNPSLVKSNTFSLEWPPKSGKRIQFPEIDQAGWFPPSIAREKMNQAQAAFLDELYSILTQDGPDQNED